MFRCPPLNEDNTHKFIYLHRLEKIYDNRPALLAKDINIPIKRKLFLLKRWRDERILFLYEFHRDSDFISDAILKKLNLLIKAFKKNDTPLHLTNFQHKKFLEQRRLLKVGKPNKKKKFKIERYGE